MKYYNYISILLFVSFSALTSCTQDDDMGNEAGSTQNFQISVSDTGFKSDNATRATENNYSTIFANGDAIGIFAVRNGAIVSNINNVKCTMQDGSWEMETNIEYQESEFKKMSFYAYYPYNDTFNSDTDFDASKTLTDGDPFEGYVANWKVDAKQDEANYTQYDLMTSIGKASGQRLKGEVSFAMQHRMALAVLQMPEVVYNFTNTDVAIDDYVLPTQAGTFKLNNQVANPYEQEIGSKTYYRFLVNPNKEFTIEGTYIAKDEKGYDHTATLTSGQAKLYKVKNPDPIKQTLSVGDYFCADGSIITKDIQTVPENIIGIVFYVGNPQPSVTHSSTYTENVDALHRDYPECKHGLVVALNNVIKDEIEANKFGDAKKSFGGWFTTDPDWKDKFIGTETKASISGFMGYNNTTLMEMSWPLGDSYQGACKFAWPYTEYYRNQVLVPEHTSKWFIPSVEELNEIAKVVSIVNTSLKSVTNGQAFESNDGAIKNGIFYWATTERNTDWVWGHKISSGSDIAQRQSGDYMGYYRMMIAF